MIFDDTSVPVFDDTSVPAFDDTCVNGLWLEAALDADPRIPLGCIIVHQQHIVAGSDHSSGLIFVWSFDTIKVNKLTKTLKGHQAHIVALQDLNTCFASCSKDGNLRIWKDFECIMIIQKCHGIDKYPTSLACYHPSGQNVPYLYSGGTDGLIISYDITMGRASNVVGGHSGWIMCLECKNDAPFLFSGSTDFTVRLWDAVSLQFLYSFEGHSESIYSMRIFEHYLVSGDRSGEIRLYDIFTSECLNVFRDYYMINSLQVFKRDGRIQLLSMGHSNYICEWDTFSQEYNCINKFHFGTIRSSMIYKNWIFTAARDGAIGIWRLEKDDAAESCLGSIEADNSYESLNKLDLSLSDQWLGVQKAFQELNQKNLTQKNEIFSLRAEVFNLKLNQQSHDEHHYSVSESKHFLDCIYDILDGHLKTASHQLVKSAMLLNEMQVVLKNDEDKENFATVTKAESSLEEDMADYKSTRMSSKANPIELRDEIRIFSTNVSVPVVLSASSCSEISISDDSYLSDDLESYYGTHTYNEHQSISKLDCTEFEEDSLYSRHNLENLRGDDLSSTYCDNLLGTQKSDV